MPAGTILLGSTVAGFFGATAVGFTAFAIGLATQTAIGLALYAISGKGKKVSGLGGYQVTANGSALDHQIIYGRTKVAGARVFDHVTGASNEYLHRILVFAGHEIDSFESIWINGYKVTKFATTGDSTGQGNVEEVEVDGVADTRFDGFIEVYKHLGSENQTVDTVLQGHVGTSVWSNNHRLRGLAYLYVRMKYDASVFPNGVPEIKAIIKGKKLYDPRTGTRAWSDNPALCIRDYLRSGSLAYAGSGSFGLGEDASEVDGDGTIADAADICDESVGYNGEVAARYTCNGAFTTDVTPVDILQTLLTSCAGTLWYAQGKWRLKAGSYTAPTLTLSERDFIGPISVSTRHSRRDNFNVVRGTYKGEETSWQFSDYEPRGGETSEAAITEDGGQKSYSDLDLLFTDNSNEAQRLAEIALRENRQQLTLQADFGLQAFKLQIGDTVGITNSRFGWTNVPFKVVGWSFQVARDLSIVVNMTLRQTDSQVYEVTDIAGSWDLANASYTSRSFDVDAASSDRPEGVYFKPDGTKMYIAGILTDAVIEYNLSTAWDVSTASQVATYDVSAEDASIYDVHFKPDGTKMYVVGQSTGAAYQYNLATAWDVTTAAYSGNSYDMLTPPESDNSPSGLFFNFDGTRMYVSSRSDFIYQYDVSEPWDLSSASYVRELDVSAVETVPESVFFKYDGTKMYVIGGGSAAVNEYDLSDAWDISSATYSKDFSVSAQGTQPRGLFIKSDGTKMYVSMGLNDRVFEYEILA